MTRRSKRPRTWVTRPCSRRSSPRAKNKKMGGLVIAADRSEAEQAAQGLLGKAIGAFTAASVYVEEYQPTAREMFVSFLIDDAARAPAC